MAITRDSKELEKQVGEETNLVDVIILCEIPTNL